MRVDCLPVSFARAQLKSRKMNAIRLAESRTGLGTQQVPNRYLGDSITNEITQAKVLLLALGVTLLQVFQQHICPPGLLNSEVNRSTSLG